jgi:hypothetical protein
VDEDTANVFRQSGKLNERQITDDIRRTISRTLDLQEGRRNGYTTDLSGLATWARRQSCGVVAELGVGR